MGEKIIRLELKRLLVAFAILSIACAHQVSRPARVNVLVYNIHAGKDAGGVDNLERVAAIIESSGADIVLLQEVDRGTSRSGGVDQLATLMRLTKMHGAFGKSLDYQGGEYGIATLSRWPITRREVLPLRVEPPQVRAGGSVEPRVAFIVETNGLTVVNTHFDASRDDTYRLQETEQLLRRFSSDQPDLVGGDFNAEPQSTVYARLTGHLRDSWTICGEGDTLTFPASKPVKRIDYLFLGPAATCDSARVIESEASDHRPVVVRIRA